MKKLVFAILMFSALNVIAQQNRDINPKLEGFSGTDEAAAEEVVQMVEIARK